MNTDSNLMEWLEPPGHGLNELKEKIARRSSRNKAIGGITATALVVLITIATFHDGNRSNKAQVPTDREWQAAISWQDEKLRVINGAALELSAPDADTRIYLVSTIPEERSVESG